MGGLYKDVTKVKMQEEEAKRDGRVLDMSQISTCLDVEITGVEKTV